MREFNSIDEQAASPDVIISVAGNVDLFTENFGDVGIAGKRFAGRDIADERNTAVFKAGGHRTGQPLVGQVCFRFHFKACVARKLIACVLLLEGSVEHDKTRGIPVWCEGCEASGQPGRLRQFQAIGSCLAREVHVASGDAAVDREGDQRLFEGGGDIRFRARAEEGGEFFGDRQGAGIHPYAGIERAVLELARKEDLVASVDRQARFAAAVVEVSGRRGRYNGRGAFGEPKKMRKHTARGRSPVDDDIERGVPVTEDFGFDAVTGAFERRDIELGIDRPVARVEEAGRDRRSRRGAGYAFSEDQPFNCRLSQTYFPRVAVGLRPFGAHGPAQDVDLRHRQVRQIDGTRQEGHGGPGKVHRFRREPDA